jgi:hypothetical protein
MQFRLLVSTAVLAASLASPMAADSSNMPRQGVTAAQVTTATARAKPAQKAKAPKFAAKSAKHKHWVCPMHDGGESDHPGPCPKCGMPMVEED